MPLDRDQLNSRMDQEIMGQGPRTPPDYIATQAAIAPVIARLLADENWSLEMLRANGRTTTNINQAVRLRFHRAYRVRVTRDSEHQRRAEELGEVLPGNNTYLQIQSFEIGIDIPTSIPESPGSSTRMTVTDPLECAALALLQSKSKGVRPPGREDDL